MELSRRGFIGSAALAAVGPVLAEAKAVAPAAGELKTGALGKYVGELPAGRYDTHIHVMGNVPPDPAALKKSIDEAGLAGCGVFSQAPYKRNRAQATPVPPEQAVDDVIAWCSGSPTFYPFHYIDPTAPDALDQVDMAVEKGIYGFKVIRADGYPCDAKTMPVYAKIAAANKPLTFHTGILWDGCASSDFFRPANWEPLLAIPRLRFALCHISWPWVDECIAVYGKLLNAISRSGERNVPEMFIDTTPGTPKIYRREALTKINTVGYDVKDHVMFGTDCRTVPYNVKWSKDWRVTDDAVYDDLGLDGEARDSIYRKAFSRYLFGGAGERKAPTADGLSRPKV